jgi:hypothetical protein
VLEGADEPQIEPETRARPPARTPAAYSPRIDPELLTTNVSPRVPPPPAPKLQHTMLDTGFGRPPPGGAAAGDVIARGRRAAGERVLQYHKVENRGGLANADLSQVSAPVKALLVVLALAILAAVAWFAFVGVHSIKERIGAAGEPGGANGELETR